MVRSNLQPIPGIIAQVRRDGARHVEPKTSLSAKHLNKTRGSRDPEKRTCLTLQDRVSVAVA
jgi:hypothetical protein